MPENVKDLYGDSIYVEAEVSSQPSDGEVFVSFSEKAGRRSSMALTPKKARKFAKMLKRAAVIAEGLDG